MAQYIPYVDPTNNFVHWVRPSTDANYTAIPTLGSDAFEFVGAGSDTDSTATSNVRVLTWSRDNSWELTESSAITGGNIQLTDPGFAIYKSGTLTTAAFPGADGEYIISYKASDSSVTFVEAANDPPAAAGDYIIRATGTGTVTSSYALLEPSTIYASNSTGITVWNSATSSISYITNPGTSGTYNLKWDGTSYTLVQTTPPSSEISGLVPSLSKPTDIDSASGDVALGTIENDSSTPINCTAMFRIFVYVNDITAYPVITSADLNSIPSVVVKVGTSSQELLLLPNQPYQYVTGFMNVSIPNGSTNITAALKIGTGNPSFTINIDGTKSQVILV